MNKKFTLLAAALMTVGTFTAASAADDVPSKDWTAGNYYYLVDGKKYLSLDGNKADSVVVKEITSFENVDKAARDSALWEITGITETAGTVYQFKNKKTNAVLSFAASQEAKPILVAGVDKWTFTDGGSLSASIGDNKTMTLALGSDNGLVFKDGSALSLTVTKPDTMTMTPQDLGDGFSTFQLTFGDQYEGNIFTGEDLIANSIGDKGFMTLQVKGDEAYPNGVKKFLGVDTLKTTINNQENVFGAGFALDSTRKVLRPNERCQHFKFVVNLQNDSLAMFVAGAPDVNGDLELVDDTVRVVYAQTGSTKVLTVSELNADAQPLQGKLPLIKVSKGTPVTIPTGTGVYFLQKISEGADNGKYYVTKNTFMGGDSVPSMNLARGQWYIKEDNGKYSVVDRQSDSEMILNQEVFAVQGKENTYLFGNDSVKISWQPVNLNDKYLGSLYFTEDELNANGYVLNLISGTSGVSDLYAYTTDSILKGKSGDAKDAAVFKLIPNDTTVVGGAQKLGDYLSVITYKLRGLFDQDTIAVGEANGLKFSIFDNALAFKFISDPTAEKYSMITKDGTKYVAMNINTSNLELTDASKAAYVNLEAVDAPEYASFASAHKRLAYNNNALVMNPLNFFAEMKDEGNPITKANYEADNFSLWVEQDTVIAGKQLYFISSGVANGGKAEANIRYYLAAKDTTRAGIDATTYAMFISHDSIKTMKDSPALFAFKTAEEGGYYLENQKELDKNGKPYVGVVNGFAVMQATPSAAFEVQTASAPTANEEMNVSEIKVISNDGQVIVTNASGRMITLSNILGQTIGVRRASSEYFSMPATSGIVLVTVEGDTTYKVIVK